MRAAAVGQHVLVAGWGVLVAPAIQDAGVDERAQAA